MGCAPINSRGNPIRVSPQQPIIPTSTSRPNTPTPNPQSGVIYPSGQYSTHSPVLPQQEQAGLTTLVPGPAAPAASTATPSPARSLPCSETESSFRPDTTFGLRKRLGAILDHKFSEAGHAESNSGRISELATAGAKPLILTPSLFEFRPDLRAGDCRYPCGSTGSFAGKPAPPELLGPEFPAGSSSSPV